MPSIARLAAFARTPLAWRITLAVVLAVASLSQFRFPHAHDRPVLIDDPATPSIAGRPAPPLAPAQEDTAFSADAARLSNARVPVADAALVAAEPFRFSGTDVDRLRARDCLAMAAWHEAGDEPAAERAVIQVVLNRVRHPAFPKSICAVVFQGAERATGCQFTFTCDGTLDRHPAPVALARARAIASAALAGAVDERVGLATHYHADYVVPRWRDGLVKIAREGAHLFYRWPGYWGSAAALTRVRLEGEPARPELAALDAAERPALPGSAPATPIEATSPVPVTSSPAATVPYAAALELRLDASASPGRYAIEALALCGDAHECRVAGRVSHDLAFVYVRKGGSGGEGAYWDCTRFQRADPAQCRQGANALERVLQAG